MKIAIVGNGKMALSCIDIMLSYEATKIQALITDPEDYGIDLMDDFCNKHNIKLFKESNINASELLENLSHIDIDYIFNINSRKLFSLALLNIPRSGVINFHNSYLPQYRGVNACSWAIINQEKEHGVTWHLLAPQKIDGGDILIQRKFEIEAKDTAFTLLLKSIQYGIDSFKTLYPKVLDRSYTRKPQHIKKGSLYLKKQTPPYNGRINFRQPYDKIDSLVRALNFGLFQNDFMPATTVINNCEFTILMISKNDNDFSGFEPGEIVEVNRSHIVVCCKDALLNIQKVQFEDKDCKIAQMIEIAHIRKGDFMMPVGNPEH